MQKIKMSLEQLSDTVPPVLARMMAVVCGKGKEPRLKTISEIARDSGLSERKVERLVWQMKYDCKLADASNYLLGCGVEILDGTRKYQFIRQWADKDFPQITDPEMRERFFKLMGFTK